MKQSTSRFLDCLRFENLRYYTIEEGREGLPDVVKVAYFARGIYDISILFLFNIGYIEVKILGVENTPLYKKEALVEGVNELYIEYKWLEFTIERDSISAKIDTTFGIDGAIDICYGIIDKISCIMGSNKGSCHLW